MVTYSHMETHTDMHMDIRSNRHMCTLKQTYAGTTHHATQTMHTYRYTPIHTHITHT